MHIKTIRDDKEASEFAFEKIQSVEEKYTSRPVGLRLKFGSCRHMKKVTASVSAGPIFSVVASDSSDNIYEAIDGVASKLEKQMRRKKKRMLKKTKKPRLRLIQDDADVEVDDVNYQEDLLWAQNYH